MTNCQPLLFSDYLYKDTIKSLIIQIIFIFFVVCSGFEPLSPFWGRPHNFISELVVWTSQTPLDEQTKVFNCKYLYKDITKSLTCQVFFFIFFVGDTRIWTCEAFWATKAWTLISFDHLDNHPFVALDGIEPPPSPLCAEAIYHWCTTPDFISEVSFVAGEGLEPSRPIGSGLWAHRDTTSHTPRCCWLKENRTLIYLPCPAAYEPTNGVECTIHHSHSGSFEPTRLRLIRPKICSLCQVRTDIYYRKR